VKTDPTETGGLFVGRRPGTRPVKYRDSPQFRGERRQRVDRAAANALLGLMVLVNLMFWGPLPLAWLWVGSRVDYATGSTFLGMVVAFVGLLFTLMAALALMRRIDLLWILMRRAGGHDQREGTIARVFAVTAAIGGTLFFAWLLLIGGLGPSLAPGS
jgi:ABC-type multidrug transport system fused ATPase/permease subunit